MRRFVERDGRLVADPEQRLPGRGAYLCDDRACAEAALRRGAFARALRRAVIADPENVHSS